MSNGWPPPVAIFSQASGTGFDTLVPYWIPKAISVNRFAKGVEMIFIRCMIAVAVLLLSSLACAQEQDAGAGTQATQSNEQTAVYGSSQQNYGQNYGQMAPGNYSQQQWQQPQDNGGQAAQNYNQGYQQANTQSYAEAQSAPAATLLDSNSVASPECTGGVCN